MVARKWAGPRENDKGVGGADEWAGLGIPRAGEWAGPGRKGSGKGLRSLTGKWWGLGVGRAWETGAALRQPTFLRVPRVKVISELTRVLLGETSPCWRLQTLGDSLVVILRLRAWLGRWDPSISINGCPVPLRHAGSPRRSSLVRRGPMGIRLQAYPVFTVPGAPSPRGPGVAPSGDG